MDLTWLLGKEWDSQEEYNTYKITSREFRPTAGFSYTSLIHPIQMTLIQEHLTTSTWIMISIKVPTGLSILESSKMLQCSEIQHLKNLSEEERTQILTILMPSIDNTRLAGYMLKAKNSILLSTNGSLAWLYHCPLMRSPPHVMNQCYDNIPLLYENAIFLVHPTARQKIIHMPRFKIIPTGLRISSNSIWKMKTLCSLSHPL